MRCMSFDLNSLGFPGTSYPVAVNLLHSFGGIYPCEHGQDSRLDLQELVLWGKGWLSNWK